jgi:hypothetical protein
VLRGHRRAAKRLAEGEVDGGATLGTSVHATLQTPSRAAERNVSSSAKSSIALGERLTTRSAA